MALFYCDWLFYRGVCRPCFFQFLGCFDIWMSTGIMDGVDVWKGKGIGLGSAFVYRYSLSSGYFVCGYIIDPRYEKVYISLLAHPPVIYNSSLYVEPTNENSHESESNSGFTHDSTGPEVRIHAPNLCNKAKTNVPPTSTMSASAVNVQVQPDEACHEEMKN